MSQDSITSSEQDKNIAIITISGTSVTSVSDSIRAFFKREGYKLEQGTPDDGVYGTGNPVLRILFGAFVKRYKFAAYITQEGDTVRLRIKKEMSGASGGIIGYKKMEKEFHRIVDIIKKQLT